MSDLVATCLWPISAEVVSALDRHFGEPVDAYVNGSQVWLRDDGPGGLTLEWRLHPVAGFRRPPGVTTHELFAAVALSLAGDGASPAPLTDLWEGLEAFSAYGEEVEPSPLAAAATVALGIAPTASGLVDHQGVSQRWEAAGGRLSIVSALFEQLRPPPD